MTRIYLLAAVAALTDGRKQVACTMLRLALSHANQDGSDRSAIMSALNYARRVA